MPKRITVPEAIAMHRTDPDAIVQAGEVADLKFLRGSTMSLRAGKLFCLLVQSAGIEITEDVQHRVAVAELNETFHLSTPELIETVDELHSTLIKLRLTSRKGRPYTKSGPILADAERDEDNDGELRYSFSPVLRQVISNSTHWAAVSRRAVLAFESRYSLRLYLLLSLRAGRRQTAQEFSTEELRELLGVPPGKLDRWQDLKVHVLERAKKEINHLAGFQCSYQPLKRGRRVVGVRLAWCQKDIEGLKAADRELNASKVGRKARREDAGERIAAEERAIREDIALSLATAPVLGPPSK